MLEIRDTVAINSVGEYLKSSKEELIIAKNKLDKDIKEICEHYVGNDANLIMAKFLEASDKLKQYSEVLDYYGGYMKDLSSYDKDNIQSSSSNFQTAVSEQLQKNSLLYKEMINKNVNINKEVQYEPGKY